MTTLSEPSVGTPAVPGTAPAGRGGPVARRRIGLDLVYTAVFGWLGFALGFTRLSDNSFFTHLVTGRWILANGIQRREVYSFTAPGVKVVGQSWLAESGYALLERWTGLFGVRALGAVLGALLLVLVFRLALRLAGDRTRATLVAVPALGGVFVLWASRPFMLGLVALVVLIWVVEVPDCTVGRYPLVSVPVIFCCWANVHGSFALGFAYLGLHVLGRWSEGARPWCGRERTLVAAAALGLAACTVNPYGLEQLWFPVHLLRRAHLLRNVVEWTSPDFHRFRGQVLLVWTVVFVVVLARSPRRVGRRDLVVTLPFLLLGFWALRNVGLAPLVGLPVVARAVAPTGPTGRPPGPRDPGSPRIAAGLLVVLLVATVGVVVRAAGEPDLLTRTFPVAALRDLDRQGRIGSRLLTTDVGAAWAELAYGSRQPVFLDDRYDTFPAGVIEDYYSLSDGRPSWERILDRRGVDTVVWKRGSALAALLASSPGWVEVHRDRTWVAYVRSGP